MIWRENDFYEPEGNSIGEIIMLRVTVLKNRAFVVDSPPSVMFEVEMDGVEFEKIRDVVVEQDLCFSDAFVRALEEGVAL